jgi:hypothetical protein
LAWLDRHGLPREKGSAGSAPPPDLNAGGRDSRLFRQTDGYQPGIR